MDPQSAAKPNDFEALHLRGVEAQTRGDYESAQAFFEQALAAKPGFAFAELALAQIRMMRTGFEQGRELYEARFGAITEGSGPDWRGLPYPRWQGESLAGKKVYLWAEQGLGDIIMFAGFLPHLLAQKPARIALGMFPKLISLFARSFPGIDIEPIDDAANHALAPTMINAFPQIEKLAEVTPVPFSLAPLKASYDYARTHGLFDVAAPLGDVLVHCMPGYVPAKHAGAYIVADPVRVSATRQRLAAKGEGRRIGISWHTTNKREATRNISLETMLPLLQIPGCHFVSLQHHVTSAEIESFCAQHGCKITVDDEVNLADDAEELAALIGAMDEVITIDNSNVHLAGALGVPTTLLLPKGCNFRWPVQHGGGTVWYKSVKALRQRELGDWASVVTELVSLRS